jgi:hypothetical protein
MKLRYRCCLVANAGGGCDGESSAAATDCAPERSMTVMFV